MKYKAKVIVEYQIEIETESNDRSDILSQIEDLWSDLVGHGDEDRFYNDTEYDYEEA